MVTLTGSPIKGNQLKAETGKIVHFWLLVADCHVLRVPGLLHALAHLPGGRRLGIPAMVFEPQTPNPDPQLLFYCFDASLVCQKNLCLQENTCVGCVEILAAHTHTTSWHLPLGCVFQASTRARLTTTEGPLWGHSSVVLGAIVPFLEPFCGHLSSEIDKVSEALALRYSHEGPCVAHTRRIAGNQLRGS